MQFISNVTPRTFASVLSLRSIRVSALRGFRQMSNYRIPNNNPFVSPAMLVAIGGLTAFAYVWKKSNTCTTANCQAGLEVKAGKFDGKVVLITGAAGDIGGTAAKKFVEEGATVILSDLPRTESILKAKRDELSMLGGVEPIIISADVTNEKNVMEMVEKVMKTTGRIDIFFNNAGVQGELCPIQEQSASEFSRVTNVNIYGVFLCLKYVSQAMIKQKKGGAIVNSASVAGLIGPANMAAYAASKFAVVGMTKTAAKDLAPYGIRVNAVAPGILEGRLWTTQVKGNARCRKRARGDSSEITASDIQEQEERMITSTPLRRLGNLSEVASVVAFLSSNDASYMSGVTLPIDGGRIP